MTPDLLYYLIHLPVIPAWALIAFAPRSIWTDRIAHSVAIPLVLGLAYTWFLAQGLSGSAAQGAGFHSLEAVTKAFSHPTGVLIGWSHYLVFDLFVGAWIARDAVRRDITKWAVLPCLFFCLMFAPIGLVLYLLLRWGMGRGGWSLHEEGA